MVKHPRRPGQSWTTFLRNHADGIAAADLFVVLMIGFKLLYVLVVLGHGRRRLIRCAVTTHPTAEWIARQIVEAFPWDGALKYLVRDRDAVYGEVVKRRLRGLGIRDRPTAPRSPQQNPYVERSIGSIRRGCIDHVIGSCPRTPATTTRPARTSPSGRTHRLAVRSNGSVISLPSPSPPASIVATLESSFRQMGYWGWPMRRAGRIGGCASG